MLIEAESGNLSSPLGIDQDSSASAGAYVSATSGENTDSPETEASYEFSIPDDGTYYLWARLYGPDDESDAIYIGIDGSWDRVYPAEQGEYIWTRVGPERDSTGKYGVSLSSGGHEVHVGHAELYARLDALFITDDWDAQPDDTDEPADDPDPAPPDAEQSQGRIAFVSDRDGNDEIYVMNADGSNQVRLTHSPADDWGHTWSPDGSKIACKRSAPPSGACRTALDDV
jgi:hypothetical protein